MLQSRRTFRSGRRQSAGRIIARDCPLTGRPRASGDRAKKEQALFARLGRKSTELEHVGVVAIRWRRGRPIVIGIFQECFAQVRQAGRVGNVAGNFHCIPPAGGRMRGMGEGDGRRVANQARGRRAPKPGRPVRRRVAKPPTESGGKHSQGHDRDNHELAGNCRQRHFPGKRSRIGPYVFLASHGRSILTPRPRDYFRNGWALFQFSRSQ